MFFTITLYLSLAICLVGFVYRIRQWFTVRIGPESGSVPRRQRVAAAARAAAAAPFGRGAGRLLSALIFDCLLQRRLLQEDAWRWAAHMLLASGFVLLILMHALDRYVTAALFDDYVSTLSPYLFLRNLFGAMVLAGAGIAVYRRSRDGARRALTKSGDWIALGVLAVIILSGVVLESSQIISASIFDEMVEDYLGTDNPDDIRALQAFWFASYGVRFPEPAGLDDPQLRAAGHDLHEESCAACHVQPQSAFVSYPLSRALIPISRLLDAGRADIWLWYLHWLACFAGLAYLPFGKFWHLVATPLQQLIAAVGDEHAGSAARRVTARALAFDACTDCAVCSLHCSVKPAYRVLQNLLILPSEKLQALRRSATGKQTSASDLFRLSEGSFICTGCYRCTRLCPSGINLQDLWQSSEQDLMNDGFPEPHVWIRRRHADEWVQALAQAEPQAEKTDFASPGGSGAALDRPESFLACIQCATCSSVCPVVAAVDDAQQDLDFTPQQVMNLLRLNLKDIARGTRMVWNCVTCYLCQENCPQGIKVADLFYELRNSACQNYAVLVQDDARPNSRNQNDLVKVDQDSL
jgi:heterodisulfide reductase subunit C/nitrate reductase gamma subunit